MENHIEKLIAFYYEKLAPMILKSVRVLGNGWTQLGNIHQNNDNE